MAARVAAMHVAPPERVFWRGACGCVLGELTPQAVIIMGRPGRYWLLPRPLGVEVEAICKHGHRYRLPPETPAVDEPLVER